MRQTLLVTLLLTACGDGTTAPDAAAPDATVGDTATTPAEDAVADALAPDAAEVAQGDDADAGETTPPDDALDVEPDAPVDADAPGDATASELPDAATTVVRAPAPGELAIAELMIDPIGRSDLAAEWIELASLADDATLDLAGCWLVDGAGRRFDIPASGVIARVSPGERFVLGKSADLEDNGGVAVDLVVTGVLLDNAAGTIALGCGDVELDRATWDAAWPLAPGRALVLAPTPLAHAPDDACAATEVYDAHGPNRGTPGAIGPDDGGCPPPDPNVDACGLLAPAAAEVLVGTALRASAWVYDAGATDLSPGLDMIPHLAVEVGAGPTAEAIAWAPALPALDLLDPAHPERDAFAAPLPPLGVGPWVVAARASLDGGATFADCGEVAVVVRPSPCDPSPCAATATATCEGSERVTTPALGTCAVDGDEARCAYPEQRLDCAALAGRCEAGACLDVAPRAAPGEVLVSEVMRNPTLVDDALGEWVELESAADHPVQLDGCALRDDGSDRVALDDATGALTLWPGDRLVLAASADAAQNGGVAADYGWSGHGAFELLNNADAVVLECDGRVVDQVRYASAGWPNLPGRAMALSPRRMTATANDAAGAWCSASAAIGGATFPDYGTPGIENSACPESVERCRLVAPAAIEAVAGVPFTVAVQIRHAGITDLSAAVDEDPLVFVQAGLGPDGWYPTWGGWTFGPAFADLAWRDDAAPREDQYVAVLEADGAADVRNAAGRVTVDGGLTWTYCDRDTTIAGGDGSQDGYQPGASTRVVVADPDPCLPNPCTTPPPAVCDEDARLVTYPSLGACDGAAGEVRCTYAADVADCPTLGGICDADLAACVGALPHPEAGDLVVTELMIAPAAVADFFGEWVELTSVADHDVNLAGCALADRESALTIDPPGHALVVPAGGIVVVGRDADRDVNGDAPIDLAWGDAFGLGNGADRISVVCDGATVDAVSWDAAAGWGVASGVALSLDPAATDPADNDAATAWCAAASPYGAGDLGTPGVPNPTCP